MQNLNIIYQYANENINIDEIKKFIPNPKIYYSKLYVEAAKGNNINLIKYLHESGHELEDEIMLNTDCLEIIKYCHNAGCQFDVNVFTNAIDNDNDDIVEYLIKNNCVKKNNITSPTIIL